MRPSALMHLTDPVEALDMDLAAIERDRADRLEARNALVDFACASDDPKTALLLALLIRD